MLIFIVIAALWGGMHSAPGGAEWNASHGHMAPTMNDRWRDNARDW